MEGFKLISFFILISASYGEEVCDSILIDGCGDMLYSIVTKPQTIPTNEDEMKSFCSMLEGGMKCLKDTVRDCPTVFSAPTTEPYLKSIEVAYSEVCGSSGKQLGKGLLKHGACLRKALDGSKCVENLMKGTQASTLEEKSLQLVSACCTFGQYEQCTDNLAKECGVEAIDAYKTTIKSLLSYLGELCTSRLTDPAKQCAGKPSKPLPEGHRKILTPLTAYAVIAKNTFGP